MKNRFPNGVSNFFLDSVIRAINYGTSPDDVFDENISFTGDEIPYSKLRAAFESSNMQFLNRFAHKVGMSLKTFKPADLPVEKVGEKFTPEEVNKMTNDKNVYDQIKEDSSKLTDFIYDKFTSNYTAYRNLAAFLNAFNMISPVEKEILTRNASSKDKAKRKGELKEKLYLRVKKHLDNYKNGKNIVEFMTTSPLNDKHVFEAYQRIM